MAVGTTRAKRRLGRYVRPLVERAGKKPDEIAKEVRCSRQTVFRLLSGDHLPRYPVVAAILGVIGASADERAKSLQLWELANVTTATIEHAADLPAKYRRFRFDEAEAVFERTLDTTIIPGMLQTAEYAKAMAYSAKRRISGPSWSESAASERRDRQSLLVRDPRPLQLHSLIDEAALARKVGGLQVVSDQLDYLLTMAELDNVAIQVIPFEVGAYGAHAGSLTLLSFAEEDEPDSAYAESLTGLDTVEDETAVGVLSDVWADVAAAALDVDQTIAFISETKGRITNGR